MARNGEKQKEYALDIIEKVGLPENRKYDVKDLQQIQENMGDRCRFHFYIFVSVDIITLNFF